MLIRDRTVYTGDENPIHFESALGQDQRVTPEGFLVCMNVPIARTGWQDYHNDEICSEDSQYIEQDGEQVLNPLYAARSRDGVIRAERREEDVFRPETLASFEGKDITDDHPPEGVAPHNYRDHSVGTVLNVRRGEGAMADFIVADLMVKEQNAIAAVRAGKREVSCGYGADYEVLKPGRVRQYNIIGNHLALVDRGRCGFQCAIGDKEPDMTTKKKPNLMQRVLAALSTNDHTALAAVADAMSKGEFKGEVDETAPDAPALEATGTHIHLHLGGEQEVKGASPAEAGAADEEEEEAPADPAAGADDMHKRMMALEAGLASVLEVMRAIAKKVGMEGGEAEEEADDGEGEEEAEGEVPEAESEDEAEGEEEPKEKDPKDKKSKDVVTASSKAAVAGFFGKKGAKDSAVRDSKPLAEPFKAALSGAEILAPGLKLPVFDAKKPFKDTADSVCLLKRRALAAALRDEKNGGAESVKLMVGDRKLEGATCDQVGIFFNGAVALQRDRNKKDDKTVGRAQPKAAAKDSRPINSTADFNARNRELHKQTAPK